MDFSADIGSDPGLWVGLVVGRTGNRQILNLRLAVISGICTSG